MALKKHGTLVHHHDLKPLDKRRQFYQAFRLRIYIKVFVTPQIFSKPIDIWLRNFAHLFTILSQTYRQEKVTISSILKELCPFYDLEFTFKFLYHLKYLQSPLIYDFETLHTYSPSCLKCVDKRR
jgi:hypothetical protein